MTLVSSIILDAYRESNLMAASASPTTVEEAEALRRLNSLVPAVLGNEAGEQLLAWPVGTAGFTDNRDVRYLGDPLPNVRLICNLEAARTINLPREISDGARFAVVDAQSNFATYPLTLNGNGHTIEDAQSLTLSSNGEARQWFFRQDLGDWVRIDTLATSSELPFPIEFDDFFITLLAMRLNPRHSQQMSAESRAALAASRDQFMARYAQKVEMPIPAGVRVNRRRPIEGDVSARDDRTLYGYPQ